MRKIHFSLLLCAGIFASGCTRQARLYPVEGPLSKQNSQVLEAQWLDSWSGSGWIKLTLPDGEECKGEYTTLEGGGTSFSSGGLFANSTWATHWGNTYSSPNTNRGTATLIGNKGTVIEIEYFVTFGSRGSGLGEDNKGNIYKIHF